VASNSIAAPIETARAWPTWELPPPLDPVCPSGKRCEAMSHGETSLELMPRREEGTRGVVVGEARRSTPGGSDHVRTLTTRPVEFVVALESRSRWFSATRRSAAVPIAGIDASSVESELVPGCPGFAVDGAIAGVDGAGAAPAGGAGGGSLCGELEAVLPPAVAVAVDRAASVDGISVTDRLRPSVALVAASRTCPRTAVAGAAVVTREVAGSPEMVDTASPTAAFEAVVAVEAVRSMVGITLSWAVLVVAVTCETALVTGATAAARGVVAFAPAVGAGADRSEALSAVVEVTGVAAGVTAGGVGGLVGSELDGFVATLGEATGGPVRDEVVGALVAADRTPPALCATPLVIPDPSDALPFDGGLIGLASGFDAGAADADAVIKSAIKNPSPQARSAKTA
jgi:hypothetical protein